MVNCRMHVRVWVPLLLSQGVTAGHQMCVSVLSCLWAMMQVGQRVFAIGFPFALDQSLTAGIVSGLGREMQSITGRTIRDVVQTDAAINPGKSA